MRVAGRRSGVSTGLIVLLALGWAGPSAARAESEGSIAGHVRDEAGGPPTGVFVELTSPPLPRSRLAVTDASGLYEHSGEGKAARYTF